MQNHNDTIIKDERRFFKNIYIYIYIYTYHFIATFSCERELESEQRLQYIDPPTLMAISVVSFSFSRAAQPEAHSAGFLYHILSPTGLQNSIGSPEGLFGRVWLSLPHLTPTRLISNSLTSCLHRVI